MTPNPKLLCDDRLAADGIRGVPGISCGVDKMEAKEAPRWHCQVNCLKRALTRASERAGDHGADGPHVSCLQTLKILARAQR
jgi:hypothetical protein